MPQIDITLFDDFLFFAFISLLFGFGDDEGEEGVVEMGTDAFLANYFLVTRKKLQEQKKILKKIFFFSILK
jgi:hypothetical protein